MQIIRALYFIAAVIGLSLALVAGTSVGFGEPASAGNKKIKQRSLGPVRGHVGNVHGHKAKALKGDIHADFSPGGSDRKQGKHQQTIDAAVGFVNTITGKGKKH
jgi:hypothetical protein